LFDNNIKNGGTLSISWVAGSQTDLLAGQRGATLNIATAGVIKIASKIAAGFGTGTIISTSAPGTKYGTLQIVNTNQFLHDSMKLAYSWNSTPYKTSVAAYDYTTQLTQDISVAGTYNILSANLVLPVELSSFATTSNGRNVVLNWSTKTEKNSDRFEVQRSTDTKSWTVVASVKAANLSNSTKEYSYTDSKLQSGKYSYRLKMVDNNGTFAYSSVVETEVALPKNFAISQNYPNPFNPTTKIDYQVPTDAKVLVEVYNIAGQRVAEVVNQDQSAGYYTIDFGTSVKLSSGVYIYRMTASEKATGNNFSAIKKMMLLK
jgi:hypothetical protein